MDKSPSDRNTRDQEPRNRAHVRLSMASVLTLAFLCVAAIVLAYIGGVMSGRQSCPVISPAMATPIAAQEQVSGKSKILAASELEFAKALRGESNQVAKLEAPSEPVKAESKTFKNIPNPAPPTVTSEERQKTVTQAESVQEAVNNEQSGAPFQEVKKDNAMYDHVLQVGAFHDEKTVDRLRQTLEGHGLRTAMQKEGKVFVVLVRLRGTPERAAEVSTLAQSLGLGTPVQRSRLPVRE